MKTLTMKARSGVTLVELLVVILIVTILSVSLLPLLKPFVVESQYAAEAIPVIGNIRTKVGLYQYDKGKLPALDLGYSTATNAIETWAFSKNGTSVDNTSVTDVYLPAWSRLKSQAVADAPTAVPTTPATAATAFFGNSIDIDNQDLAGKRCRPVHFQYCVVKNGSSYCYVIGCFGDNNGLPQGTGYAVCEINVKGSDGKVYKKIGTWKRYKATTDGQITFATITQGTQDANLKKTCAYCPIPAPESMTNPSASNGTLAMVTFMETYGWEF